MNKREKGVKGVPRAHAGHKILLSYHNVTYASTTGLQLHDQLQSLLLQQ